MMGRRFLAVLLTAALLTAMFSFGAFADEAEALDDIDYAEAFEDSDYAEAPEDADYAEALEDSDYAEAAVTAALPNYNGTTMAAYRAWTRTDSRWKNLKLGTSKKTVGNAGSLIVALTKVMIQAGLWKDGETVTGGKTVADMVALLNSRNCFYPAGTANLGWQAAANALGLGNCGVLVSKKVSVSQELSQILSWVKSGRHLLIAVDTATGTHWVTVDEGMTLATGDVYIMDSDPATTVDVYPLLTDYRYIVQINAFTGGKTHAHNLVKKVVAPTYESCGWTYYTCSSDGEGYYLDYVPALTNPFVDVQDSTQYYYQPVLWCMEHNLVYGIDSTHFAPTLNCTRAQVVTFLYRAAGEPAVYGTNPFTDVTEDSWYYNAVLWGYQNHIIYGLTDTTFGPDAAVSRSQFVTFLYRAAGEPAVYGTNPFADVTEDSWYYSAVLWGYQNQIVYGMDDSHFSPQLNCTRGQVATFLYRYLNR